MPEDHVIHLTHDPNAQRSRATRLLHNPNAQRRQPLRLLADPAAPWNHGPNRLQHIKVCVPEYCPYCHSGGDGIAFATITENGQLKWQCPVCESTF